MDLKYMVEDEDRIILFCLIIYPLDSNLHELILCHFLRKLLEEATHDRCK